MSVTAETVELSGDVSARSTILTVRGLALVVRIVGDRGPWVALVTGGRRGHDEFIPLASKLAAAGFRVILHDRRNTGASEIRIEGDEAEEAIWADDLLEILTQLEAVPAFVGGSSSGSRVALLFALRHPEAVRGLLLCRVTGGPTAASRLPENYYDQFIRAAEAGGMAAVCATAQYRERIAANPSNRDRLMSLDPADYLRVMRHWRDLFVDGAHHAVMGISDDTLRRIDTPAIVIPGNDRTHSRASGLAAHRLLPNCELHELDVCEEDVPLIPFEDWSPFEPEIVERFGAFMRRLGREPQE